MDPERARAGQEWISQPIESKATDDVYEHLHMLIADSMSC